MRLFHERRLRPADQIYEVLRSTYALFDNDRDSLTVYPERDAVRVRYRSALASGPDADVTFMELVHCFTAKQLWIGQLTVSSSYRRQGIGSSLARAAEEVAAALGVDCVMVYPLTTARTFWVKLRYRPSSRMARVMFKKLCSGATETRFDRFAV